MRQTYQIVEKEAIQKGENPTVLMELSLPLAEILGGAQGVIETYAKDFGLKAMQAIMEEEQKRLIGAKRYQHQDGRAAYRWGKQKGYVVFHGQKMPMSRPRVKGNEGEIPLTSYRLFQTDGRMQKAVAERLVCGVSTRKYKRVIEAVVEGYGVEKSSVSREFKKHTKKVLEQFCERSLADVHLCAILIDGVRYADHLLVVALGVAEDGTKQVLGLWQGATENTEVCKQLLEDLIRRGLSRERCYLFVLDGSKALRGAVERVFGEDALVQRCQVHKRRNVKDHLPPEVQGDVDKRIRAAYQMTDYTKAKESLLLTMRYLERLNPSAARSLEEGLEETLTLHRMQLPEALRRSLCSTNLIESCFSFTRHITKRVTRWRHGDHVQRWAATAFVEAEKQFRKIQGYRTLPTLINILNRFDKEVKSA